MSPPAVRLSEQKKTKKTKQNTDFTCNFSLNVFFYPFLCGSHVYTHVVTYMITHVTKSDIMYSTCAIHGEIHVFFSVNVHSHQADEFTYEITANERLSKYSLRQKMSDNRSLLEMRNPKWTSFGSVPMFLGFYVPCPTFPTVVRGNWTLSGLSSLYSTWSFY